MNSRPSSPTSSRPPAGGGTRPVAPAPAQAAGHASETRGLGLAAENALLRLAIEQMPLGLCVFDASDRLVLANRRYAAIWALPEKLLQPGTGFATIMQATRGREVPTGSSAPPPLSDQAAVRRREWAMDDGRTIEVVVTRMPDGSCVALHEDITDQRRSEARVAYLARHDALTGLPNRHAMLEDLQHLLTRHARGEDLAVLCLDLDRFKHVNDTLGHAAGDALLRQVAQRLQACARDTDRVVRLGGDEFAVLQCGAPQPDSSSRLARRLIAAIERPFDLDGHSASIGASIGIAVAPFDGETSDALLKNADLALYRAKSEGRGTLRYFEPEMDTRAQARRALEADLRRALEHGEFELVYQPLVDVSGGFVSGVEALLRWHHPTRGSVPPLDFITLAEETGLIVPIGRWVLQQACRDASSWPAPVRVAVNVSAVQFHKGSLLSDVAQALEDAGLEAHRLEIEITESVLMQQAPQTLAALQELRRLGVRIAMDDFGTGYSSLSYLRSFPFDRIKIDRSFARDVEHDADAQSIIRAVTSLGRSLDMATTMEGIETSAELDAVRREGCVEVQGYFYSTPRPAADIPHLIATLIQPSSAQPTEESADD